MGYLIIAALTVDGVLSALMGAFLLPSYIGSIPFPISALFSGLLNLALVWAAYQWTDITRVAAAPLFAFLATVLAMLFIGPGGDRIFGGAGIMEFSPLLFVALGVGPPIVLIQRHQNAVSSDATGKGRA